MVTKIQRELMLAGIALALGATTYTVYVEWPTSTASSPASNQQEQRAPGARTDRQAQAGGRTDEAPDVHLDALATQRTKPGSAGRDLFRFREKPPPPPPPPPPPRVPTPAEQAAASAPPPPPPIALKFIGFVDAEPAGGKRLAFLSDGRGSPLSGHEGDTVLGQYRILRIGAESIEMSYLDGRGRQTIRLTGS